MPRPFKCRRIGAHPEACYFKPRGVPLFKLEEVALSLDEFEAVRLGDLQGVEQEEAGKRMGVSRQTFGNILASARRKIAEALVHGKALKIEGGIVQMTARKFVCSGCKHEWEVPFGIGRPGKCPKCGNADFHRAPEQRGQGRGGAGAGGGLGRGGQGRGRCCRGRG